MPTIGGSAALPSVAEVYVGEVLQSRFDVRPGPFAATDVPVVAGEGEVRLAVRDMLGRETVVTERYYAAPLLLRRALPDYSYEVSFLRHGFGSSSFDYREPFAALTQRYGISDQLTGELHLAASSEVRQAALSAALAWPGVGMVTAGAAVTQSDAGVGTRLQLGFERRAPQISYGAVAEWTGDDFVTLGSVPQGRKHEARMRAFVGMPTAFGSLGSSYTARLAGDEADLHIFTASASIRLGGVATLNLLASLVDGPQREAALRAVLAVPLGRGSSATARSVAGSQGAEYGMAYRRSAEPAGGWGFGFEADAGRFPRVRGRAELRTGIAAFDGELSLRPQGSAARLAASGALGLVGGVPFATRRLSSSFAVVDLEGLANVRVYADNVLVGRSGADGRLVVPELRAFEDNPIRIEAVDVPLGTELVSDRLSVRPPAGSGLTIKFEAARGRAAIVQVRLEDGSQLPTGTPVEIAPAGRTVVSLLGGVHLFTTSQLTTVWGDGSGTTAVLPVNGGRQILFVYGLIPARQNVAAGSYGDVILVTVIY